MSWSRNLRSRLAQPIVQPIRDVLAGLNQLAAAERPVRSMSVAFVALAATWFLYVLIHELLHAAGCLLGGGTVSRLEIAPEYGGTLLAQVFPFVKSGGAHAGRLSGFDTHGSDLIYLITDFAPFLLTIFLGVPLLRASARSRRPTFFGAGVVVGLAPFTSLIGDYYEMGSIVVTRGVTLFRGDGQSVAYEGLRSDDLLSLIGQVCAGAETLSLNGPAATAATGALILVAIAVGLSLACLTYAVGSGFSGWVVERKVGESPGA